MNDLISRQAAIDALEREKSLVERPITETRWFDFGLRKAQDVLSELPSVQPEKRTEKRTETHACDLIDRQAAIDIERNATVDTNPSHFEAHQKFTQFMDDAEISSFGRWQWSNGFNTALTAVGIDLKKLPSAQPTVDAIPIEFIQKEIEDLEKSLDFYGSIGEYDALRIDAMYQHDALTGLLRQWKAERKANGID